MRVLAGIFQFIGARTLREIPLTALMTIANQQVTAKAKYREQLVVINESPVFCHHQVKSAVFETRMVAYHGYAASQLFAGHHRLIKLQPGSIKLVDNFHHLGTGDINMPLWCMTWNRYQRPRNRRIPFVLYHHLGGGFYAPLFGVDIHQRIRFGNNRNVGVFVLHKLTLILGLSVETFIPAGKLIKHFGVVVDIPAGSNKHDQAGGQQAFAGAAHLIT